jgi:NAD(P)-dependent dehydrogenase (short-subunit alcohol dehydrogenase family)
MPISSPFGRHSTAADIVRGRDLNGRTVLVTGGAGGLGLEAVRALAGAGAEVTVTARNADAASKALRAAGLSVTVAPMDLAELASVRAFANHWADRPLDILINNAGVMHEPLGQTADGFESHIGINHLSHFLLSVLLTPALERGTNSRVIAVSSSAHRLSSWQPCDPAWHDRAYDPMQAYGESKSANALFAFGYDRRHAASGVRAFSLMPGVIVTPLMRHIPGSDIAVLTERMRHVVKSPEQGASTIVWAAIAPELDSAGGLYLEDCAEAAPMDPAVPGMGVAPHVQDAELAAELWRWSVALCRC